MKKIEKWKIGRGCEMERARAFPQFSLPDSAASFGRQARERKGQERSRLIRVNSRSIGKLDCFDQESNYTATTSNTLLLPSRYGRASRAEMQNISFLVCGKGDTIVTSREFFLPVKYRADCPYQSEKFAPKREGLSVFGHPNALVCPVGKVPAI